jgi:hypothetical protein
MPKPYSDDLGERVIEAVEAGASRRNTGSAKAKPSGAPQRKRRPNCYRSAAGGAFR